MNTAFLLFLAVLGTSASDGPPPEAPPVNDRVITTPPFQLPPISSDVSIEVNGITYKVQLGDVGDAGKAFNDMDDNNNKELTIEEIKRAYRDANLIDQSNGLTPAELASSPFAPWTYELSPNGELVDIESIKKLFSDFDLDENGTVTQNEVIVYKTATGQ